MGNEPQISPGLEVLERDTPHWLGRLEFAISVAIQFAILILAIAAFKDRLWLTGFSGSVVLLLTFVPAIIERQYRVRLPIEITLFTCVFLYASFALGEVRDFYDRFWWWDLLLHASSAVVIGTIGFLAVYVFYMTHRIRIEAIYVAIASFGLAMTVGTLWEIFEFLMDWFFGTNMQRSGLRDTMSDLMVNAGGAFLAASCGFYYVRHEDRFPAVRLIQKLIERRRNSL